MSRGFERPLLCFIVAVAACDQGTAALPSAPSKAVATPAITTGTRLKAVVWEVDGSRMFRHFFDVERQEECSFVEAGVVRYGPGPAYWCLPRAITLHDATGPLALFADAACSTPVAVQPFDGPVAYVLDRPADACAERFTVHRAGAPRATTPFFRDGDRCVEIGSSIVTQALGSVVPLDSFVRAVEERHPGSGRIWPLELVTADGARQPFGAWDRDRVAVTRVQDPGILGDSRWLPARVAFAGAGTLLFSDAACRGTPVATKVARDALCPLGAAFAFDGECGRGDFIELGARLVSGSLHQLDENGACVAASGNAVLAYDRGAVIPRASFATAARVEQGGAHVKLRGWSEPATGAPITTAWETFVDVGTNEPCTPNDAIDGTVRCLPTASAAVSIFADAGCTTPAYERGIDACGDSTPAPAFIRALGRAYEVGPEAPAVFERDGGTCIRRAVTPSTRAYALEEIDVARFAPAVSREL